MARMHLTTIALHCDHHLMEGLIETISFIDHPVKALCCALVALHTHRMHHAH